MKIPLLLGTFTSAQRVAEDVIGFNLKISKKLTHDVFSNFMMNENEIFREYILDEYGYLPSTGFYYNLMNNGRHGNEFKNGILYLRTYVSFHGEEFFEMIRLSTIGSKTVYILLTDAEENKNRFISSLETTNFPSDEEREFKIFGYTISSNREYYQIKREREMHPNKDASFYRRGRNKG